jgi:aminoglycoside phosphotransferase family enzyme
VGFFLSESGYNGPMNIVTALEDLSLEGIKEDHDRVIETVLSKLFVRGEEVYKAYKHRTADFADLADRDMRRKYIAEDFFWNNAMAPEIYLELRHVKHDGERFVHVEDVHGEDWYIVMKKIDTSQDLMRAIESGVLPRKALALYVRTLLERILVLTEARRGELEEFFDKDAAHVRSEVLGACDWAAFDGAPYLTPTEVARAKVLMERALEKETYFQNPIEHISVVIDTNAENILFLDGKVSFIDVMPPKDAWRVHDRYFLVCRTSADIRAQQGDEHADILHETYGAHTPLPPEMVRTVYEIAASLIQVPYRKMVGRDDLAVKYADHVRRLCGELEELFED